MKTELLLSSCLNHLLSEKKKSKRGFKL